MIFFISHKLFAMNRRILYDLYFNKNIQNRYRMSFKSISHSLLEDL